MKISISLILVAIFFGGGLAQTPQLEKQAVALVKRTPVSTLEEEMPRRPFADWLKELVGAQAGIIWQLSECEQTGVTPSGADAPACVEANALLPDGRKVVVMIAVGTFKKGLTGDPGFYYAIIEQRDQLYSLSRLRDLPEGLRSPETLKDKAGAKLVYVDALPKPPLPTETNRVPGSAIETPPPPLSTPILRARPELRRVSEGALIGSAVKKVSPAYPASAKRVNAWGEIQVLIVISETGRVIEARAISGHLLLRQAAVAAARQWVFTPTTLNGAPVPSQGVLTFVFDRP